MTSPVRSHKTGTMAGAPWRKIGSPGAANDTTLTLPRLSRSAPKDPAELAQLRATLDLEQPSDLRAATMLILLGLGLRKRELVALDVSDIVTIGAIVCVAVESRARSDHRAETFLPLMGDDALVLRRYLERQHGEAAALTSPLFYRIELSRSDRLARASLSSVGYWLFELRLRARARIRQAAALRPRSPR